MNAVLLGCLAATSLASGACGELARSQRAASPPHALPLVLLPPKGPAPVMALVMSGDGNWANFIAQMADTLSERGVPVVGLESRSYLSRPRSPGELAKDLEPVIREYLRRWGAQSFFVVGYSRGADFAPFVVNRLPEDLRSQVRGVALLSPTRMASFEFHLLDLIRYRPRDSDLDALPEVDALAPIPVLCVYGTRDSDTLCPELPDGLAEDLPTERGHRLDKPGQWADLVLDRFSEERAPGASPAPPRR